MEETNAKCAWGVTTGISNINIAVLDIGFDPDHPDRNEQSQVKENTEHPPSPLPTGYNCFHGTPVHGIVGATINNGKNISGICSGCTVNDYLWEDIDCYTQFGDWFATIDRVYADNDVINVSAIVLDDENECPYIDAAQQIRIDLMEKVTSSGTVVVLGAGNKPDVYHHCNWANIPGVINVSGSTLNAQGELVYNHSSTARNEFIDICAPSANVPTIFHPLDPETDSFGGTSAAAPLVSGTVGLMLSENPCLTPACVEEIIKETAIPHRQEDLNNYAGLIGAGMLDISAAVNGARGEFEAISDFRVWNNDHFLSCDLIIENGGVLIIDGALVEANPDVKIIVESGGNLVTKNNARLTNSEGHCLGFPGLWGGIEVRRGATLGVGSSSIIERAKIGILSGNSFNQNSNNNGVITVVGARFLNNSIGMSFLQNAALSRSTIENTEFIIDREDFLFTDHIKLDRIRGLEIKGCRFINNKPYGFSNIRRGDGIHSCDANFNVTKSVSDSDIEKGNQFIGLSNGVHAVGINSNLHFEIRHSEFRSNRNGVKALNVHDFEVSQCEFIFEDMAMRSVASDPNVENSIVYQNGIYTEMCSGYDIFYNSFEEINSESDNPGPILDPTPTGNEPPKTITSEYLISTGTRIHDSGEEANLILQNEFNNCDHSNLAFGLNKNTIIREIGLQYFCNVFNNNNVVDIGVSEYGNNNVQGIARKQGRTETSCENKFDQSSALHISNDLEQIEYFHNDNLPETPTKVSGALTIIVSLEQDCVMSPPNSTPPNPPQSS